MISSDSENSWIILNNTHEKSKTHIIWKPKETVSISVTGVFVLYALNRKSHISKRKHQFHVQLIEFQSLKIWIQSENSAKREMNAAAAAKKILSRFYRARCCFCEICYGIEMIDGERNITFRSACIAYANAIIIFYCLMCANTCSILTFV